MRNHSYSDYLDDEHFLEVVERYTTKYDNDFEAIKNKISREVSMTILLKHNQCLMYCDTSTTHLTRKQNDYH